MSRFAKIFSRYADLIPDYPGFLGALTVDAPALVRVNTLKLNVDTARDALAEAGWEVSLVTWCPSLLSVTGGPGVALGATLRHALGHLYLQSAASALSAWVLAPRAGDRVLDLCAAPGSKTTFLAQLMKNAGVLIANEPNARRSQSLLANLERVGATCAAVTNYAGQNFPLGETFDRVLVDAPCSGEGTWRGREARPRPVKDKFRSYLVAQQTALLKRGYQLLRPGGELVYSTCTYAPEENEAVVASLLADSDAAILDLDSSIPGERGVAEWQGRVFPDSLCRARRLYPHRFNSEGFFVARLARP